MPTNAEKTGPRVKRVRRATPKVQEDSAPVRPPVEEEVFVMQEPVATRPARFGTTGGIRYTDLTAFLRQLIMLLEAGTPILKSLRTLSERGEKPAVRALVSDIAQYVEIGNPVWQAFERHPKYFDVVFVNLVKASEASGTLVPVLQRLVNYRERRETLRKRVRGAMLYPVILMFACFGAIWFIASVVMPEFESMFEKFQVQIPSGTIVFMAVCKAIGHYWWVGILAVAALVALYKLWYVQNPVRRLTADYVKLRVPILGPILRKNAIVEFTRTMSLLLRSGLSMMSTLELTRNAIHNRAVAQTLQGMRDSVERGGGLEQPLREASHIIPSVVADMMVTGEESGRLDSISDQIANTYEEDVNVAINTLGEALQPILTVILGVLVIIVMLAVFLPLVSMIGQMSAGGGA